MNLFQTIHSHKSGIFSAKLTNNGKNIISTDSQGICFWQKVSHNQYTLIKSIQAEAKKLVTSYDEQFIASTGETQKRIRSRIRLWSSDGIWLHDKAQRGSKDAFS